MSIFMSMDSRWMNGVAVCRRRVGHAFMAAALLGPLTIVTLSGTAQAEESGARVPRGGRPATPVVVTSSTVPPAVPDEVTTVPTTSPLLSEPEAFAAGAPDLGAAAITLRAGWTQRTDAPASGAPMTPFIEGMTGYSGWFRHTTPAIGNIDGDSALEIVIGSLDGKIYAWNPDGTRVSGWPRNMDSPTTASQPINGSVTIADIDGDAVNEIVAANDNGWVFAFDGSGNIKPGWPQFTAYNADYPANCGVKGVRRSKRISHGGRLER